MDVATWKVRTCGGVVWGPDNFLSRHPRLAPLKSEKSVGVYRYTNACMSKQSGPNNDETIWKSEVGKARQNIKLDDAACGCRRHNNERLRDSLPVTSTRPVGRRTRGVSRFRVTLVASSARSGPAAHGYRLPLSGGVLVPSTD